MKRGAIYAYQYLDRQSRLLSSVDIRNADCDIDGHAVCADRRPRAAGSW